MAHLILLAAVVGGLALIRFAIVIFNYWRFPILDLEYPVPMAIAVEHAHSIRKLCEVAGTPNVFVSVRSGRLRVMCECRGMSLSGVQRVRDLMAIAELMFGATVQYKPARWMSPCHLPLSPEFLAKLEESAAQADEDDLEDDWDLPREGREVA